MSIEKETAVLTFLALAFLGFVLLAGGAIFGHDHDHDVHFDHDHDVGHAGEPTVSIFSLKVIGAFIMAFGCGGATATWLGYGGLKPSLVGLVAGLSIGFFMYGILRLLYSQQSDSLVSTDKALGKTGVVVVEVGEQSIGSVDVMLEGQTRNYLARSSSGVIPKGDEVKVVRVNGSELVVETVTHGVTESKIER
jgi:membrane protein implicated in regulation of membrane protease activity